MKIFIAASNMVHINNFHRPYIERLRAEGHQVYIMASGEGADFDIGFEKRPLSFTNLRLTRQIKKIIKSEKPDAIYLHTTLAAFWIRMALKGMKNRPYVINTVHGYLFGQNSSRLHNAVYLCCEKLVKKQTDDIIVMNGEDYEIATKNKLCLENVYFSKGMGVDFKDCDVQAHKERTGKIALLYVGELSKRKNQLFLVKAMKQLKDYTLTLVGDGDLRAEIEEYISKEGLGERVFITGFTSKAREYINECDIYVSASNIEGLPFNIMEAMYLKKPIVASSIKGQSDLLPKEMLYPPNNMEEYIRLLMNTNIGKVEYNMEEYSLDAVLPQNMALYLKPLLSDDDQKEIQPTVAKEQPLVY